jgi:hypothetical protein
VNDYEEVHHSLKIFGINHDGFCWTDVESEILDSKVLAISDSDYEFQYLDL